MREYPTLPKGTMFKDLSWEDKRFVEEYLCNRTEVSFTQENYYDSIGTVAYVDQYKYVFKCELLEVVNDKIRIHYWIPVEEPNYRSQFFNSLGRTEPEFEKNLTTVFFKRSSEFKAQINCEFSDDLKDLRSWYALFHTRDSKNRTKYNNWNFTTSLYWDSVDQGFWFD